MSRMDSKFNLSAAAMSIALTVVMLLAFGVLLQPGVVSAAPVIISKTVSDANPTEGDVITFTITVSDSTTSTPTITDTYPAGLTLVNAGTNNAGATGSITDTGAAMIWRPLLNSALPATNYPAVLTLVMSVDAGASDLGTITNQVVADSGESAEANLRAEAPASDFTLTKTVDNATPMEGDIVTYVIVITDITRSTPVLTDTLPAGVTLTGFDTNNDADGNVQQIGGDTLVWDPIVDPVLSSTTFYPAVLTVTVRVDDGAGDLGVLTNSIVADNGESATADIDPESPVVIDPDFTIVKTVDNATPMEGDTIVWTITVTDTVVSAPVITDVIPAGLTATGFNANNVVGGTSVVNTGTAFVWQPLIDPSLPAANYPAVLILTMTVDSGAAALGTITNTVVTDGGDSAEASITLDAPVPAALELDKMMELVGTTLTYTINITNTGGEDARIRVMDDMNGVQADYCLDPAGDVITDQNGDPQTPIAGFTRTGFDTVAAGQMITFVCVATVDPQIDVEKSPASQTVVAGGSADFMVSITATNYTTSAIRMENVTISDPLETSCETGDNGNFGAIVGSAGFGSFTSIDTCSTTGVTASFVNVITVTADINFENIVEAAIIDDQNQDVDGTLVSETVTYTATISDSDAAEVLVDDADPAALELDKMMELVGTTLTYTINITNTGGEDARIRVMDDMDGIQADYCLDPAGDVITDQNGDPQTPISGFTRTGFDTVPAGQMISFVCVATVDPQIDVEKNPATQTITSGSMAVFIVEITATNTTTSSIRMENVTISDPTETSCETGDNGNFSAVTGSMGFGGFTAGDICTTSNVTASFVNVITVTADINFENTAEAAIIDDQNQDVEGTLVSDTVTYTATISDSDAAAVIVEGDEPPAALEIDKMMELVGTTLTYTINISNTGGEEARIRVMDDMNGIQADYCLDPNGDVITDQNGDPQTPISGFTRTGFDTIAAGQMISFVCVATVDPQIEIAKNPATQTIASGDSADFTVAITASNYTTSAIRMENVTVSDPLTTSCETGDNGNITAISGSAGLGGFASADTCSATGVTAGFVNVITVTADINFENTVEAAIIDDQNADVPGTLVSDTVTYTATVSDSDTAEVIVEEDQTPSDFSLTKTVDNATPNEGDTVTYVIVVTDTVASTPTLTDTLPAGVTYLSFSTNNDSDGNVEQTGSTLVWTPIVDPALGTAFYPAVLTVTVTVDEGAADMGVLTNLIEADNGESDTADIDPVADDPPPAPELSLVKTVDNATPLEETLVTYRIVVTSTEASTPTITDTLPAGVSFVSYSTNNDADGSIDNIGDTTFVWTPLVDPALGADFYPAVLTITVRVDEGTADDGILTNIVTADNGVSDTADIDPMIEQPEQTLFLDKTVDETAPAEGDLVTYVIVATDTAGSTPTITDTLPAGVTFDSFSTNNDSDGNVDQIGNTLVWTPIVNAALSAQFYPAVLTVTVRVDAGAADMGVLTNLVAADNGVSDTADIDPVPGADPILSLTKTVDNATPAEGDLVIYEIVATGSERFMPIFTDTLPAGVSFVSYATNNDSDGNVDNIGNTTFVWTPIVDPALAANFYPAVLTITVRVDEGAADLGVLTNSVVADSGERDTADIDPVGDETPTATPMPTDEATATPMPTDEATATPMPTDEATATPMPTDEATATPMPTDEATPTPMPTDEATSTPMPTDEPTSTPTPETPTATPSPTPDVTLLGINKTVDNPMPQEGQIITWTISVTSTETLTPIITDMIPDGLTYVSASANNVVSGTQIIYTGASIIWQPVVNPDLAAAFYPAELVLTMRVDAGAAALGTIVNTVSADSGQSASAAIEPTADDTPSGLVLSKTVNNATPEEGDVITYVIVISDTEISAPTVTDIVPDGLFVVGVKTNNVFPGQTVVYDEDTNTLTWYPGLDSRLDPAFYPAVLTVTAEVDTGASALGTLVNVVSTDDGTSASAAINIIPPPTPTPDPTVSPTPLATETSMTPTPEATSTPMVDGPSIALEKSLIGVDGNTTLVVGDVITYQIVAINNGSEVLANVDIDDVLTDDVTCDPIVPTILTAGESITCLARYVLTSGDIAAQTITNTANVAGQTIGGVTVTNTAVIASSVSPATAVGLGATDVLTMPTLFLIAMAIVTLTTITAVSQHRKHA